MYRKEKWALGIIFGFLCIFCLLSAPTYAFSSDSFSQKEGDTLIWNITVNDGYSMPLQAGDQLKFVVTKTNTTSVNGLSYDAVFVLLYNSSDNGQTWTLLTPTEQNIGLYNGTHFVSESYYIVPHNATAIKININSEWAYFEHVSWYDGPHGYDGIIIARDGSIIGDLGKERRVMEFNSDGVLQKFTIYNGTGSGWKTIFNMELSSLTGIPGYNLLPVVFGLAAITISYLLISNNKEKYKI